MIRFSSDRFGWIADSEGTTLTVRTNRAREIVDAIKQDTRYTVEIRQARKKRSLDQNAMYWSIIGQLAAYAKISTPRMHNAILRRYGEPERYGDQMVYVVLPDTEEAADQAAEAETYHLKPTSQTREGKDGNTYRTYILMRGSSTYTTAEMTRLIDGAQSEAAQMGVTLIWEE